MCSSVCSSVLAAVWCLRAFFSEPDRGEKGDTRLVLPVPPFVFGKFLACLSWNALRFAPQVIDVQNKTPGIPFPLVLMYLIYVYSQRRTITCLWCCRTFPTDSRYIYYCVCNKETIYTTLFAPRVIIRCVFVCVCKNKKTPRSLSVYID